MAHLNSLEKKSNGTVTQSRGTWTPLEDEALTAAVEKHGAKNWKKIAEAVPGRSDVQCLHRWQKVLNPDLVKGPWTEEEDNKVRELVKLHGAKKWSLIASYLPGRIGKQCRERWTNHLDPAIKKGSWEPWEDDLIISLQQSLGNKWAKIAKHLPGRTDNAVKNRFNSTISRRIRQPTRSSSAKKNEIERSVSKESKRYRKNNSNHDSEENSYDTPEPTAGLSLSKKQKNENNNFATENNTLLTETQDEFTPVSNNEYPIQMTPTKTSPEKKTSSDYSSPKLSAPFTLSVPGSRHSPPPILKKRRLPFIHSHSKRFRIDEQQPDDLNLSPYLTHLKKKSNQERCNQAFSQDDSLEVSAVRRTLDYSHSYDSSVEGNDQMVEAAPSTLCGLQEAGNGSTYHDIMELKKIKYSQSNDMQDKGLMTLHIMQENESKTSPLLERCLHLFDMEKTTTKYTEKTNSQIQIKY